MFSRLFTLALLVLVDLPVDAAPLLNSDQNRMEEALNTYGELTQKDSETYLPYVAITCNNLAIWISDQNLIEEGRKEYEEALKIYRELGRKNPKTYLPGVALILNDMGFWISLRTG